MVFFETKILFTDDNDVKCFLDNDRSVFLSVDEIHELDAELKYYNEHIKNIFKGKAPFECYENITDKIIFQKIQDKNDFIIFDEKYYIASSDSDIDRLPHFYLEINCSDFEMFYRLFNTLTQTNGFNDDVRYFSYFPLFMEEIKYLFNSPYNIDKNFSLGLGEENILPLTQKVLLSLS